ncbi:hypothetical protein IQ07DRAFT_581577 [Pyrenochaeta sp. DS3sAY3a]|nr:hypothetical protein IQ07DRAFT_581577 [Pyrenochaeta sp. DS3sAY3a]
MDREPSTVSPLMGTSADSLSTVDMRHGTLDARKAKGDKLTIIERSTDGSESSTSSQSWKWSHYIWWLETLCAVLAIGAFIGIVATVEAFDGSPLPEWPYRVSINAFIASYSVILKTSVGLILAEGISHIKWTNLKRPGSLRSFWVHDEASRGPWGAVHLLFNDKGRHISSLGAIITVLILFLEPFSQQIISFPDCDLINNTVVATIPRTNLYEFEGAAITGGVAIVPWDVRNSVNQGMFATNKPQVEVSCNSGNCTFPGTYSSLAFCSVCNDMTDSLTKENRYANISNLTNAPDFARYPNVTLSNPEDKSSNLTLQIVTSVGSVEENIRSLVARGYPAIEVIRALDPETYVAYSCKISPCVRSYEGKVKNGQFLETQQSEHMIPRNLMYQAFRVADLDCLRDSKKDQLREMGYDLEANPRWLPYNVTVGFNKTSGITYKGFCEYMPEDKIDKFCNKTIAAIGNQRYPLTDEAAKIVPAECVYSMSDMAGTSLNSNLFRHLFKGDITEWGEMWTSGPSANGSEPLMAIWNAGSGNGTLEDMSALMRNISETLTTHVRHNGNGNFSQPFTGEVHYNSTCISVRWEWITYSGAIVAFTLIFFIWVVVQAKVDQAQLRKAWESHDTHAPFYDFKSSALTLLFHGLDDNSRRDLVDVGSTNRTSEMAKRSKNIDIQLVATERGWKLAAVGPQG